MSKYCPECDAPMSFKKGKSKKNGKNWAGWFCQDKDNCGYVDWQKETESNAGRTVKEVTEQKEQTENNGNGKEFTVRTMVMSYAKDLVVAQMATEKIEHPFKSTIMGFRLLLKECLSPYSVRFKDDQTVVDTPEEE